MKRLITLISVFVVMLCGLCSTALAQSVPTPERSAAPFAGISLTDHLNGRDVSSASPTVGETLTTTNGSWSNNPSSYAYQWYDCNAGATTCQVVAHNGTSQTYVIQSSDSGYYIRVGVTASNTAGASLTAYSALTGLVPTSASIPANTSLPTISTSGGTSFTATDGGWSNTPTSYTYEWQDCNSTATTCNTISGSTTTTSSTTNSYTVANSDAGYYLRVGVAASNTAGTSAFVFSGVSGQIASSLPVETSAPTLAGSAVQGDQITLTPGTFSNETTQTGTWEQCPSATSTTCTATTATGATYTLSTADPVGDYIRLMETATNGSGNTVVWSNAIGPITAAAPGGGGSGGYTGTCTETINPGTNVGTAESSMSGGQVLCLNSGTYGNTTTNHYTYSASGSSGSPIIVTSGPGQTATLEGFEQVNGSYITLEYMNIDESNNQISNPTTGANPVPPCAAGNKAEAIEFESGSHDTLQYNNIYESVAATREIDIYIIANNTTVKNNKISNGGSCSQTQHLIYDSAGSGTVITGNWFWDDSYGYAVQIYPQPSAGTISSNVFDDTLDGIVDDTAGAGGTVVTHNVAIHTIRGAFLDCYAGLDDGGSHGGDTISNNAYVSPVTMGCSSEAGITFSGNISLSADPFVSSSTHNYQLGTNSSATAISGYGLWNGVGPPTPDPALTLSSRRLSDKPDQTTGLGILLGSLLLIGGIAIVVRKRWFSA